MEGQAAHPNSLAPGPPLTAQEAEALLASAAELFLLARYSDRGALAVSDLKRYQASRDDIARILEHALARVQERATE